MLSPAMTQTSPSLRGNSAAAGAAKASTAVRPSRHDNRKRFMMFLSGGVECAGPGGFDSRTPAAEGQSLFRIPSAPAPAIMARWTGPQVANRRCNMEKRPFGKTDMKVSVLGFGGAEIGFEKAAPEAVARLLGDALD